MTPKPEDSPAVPVVAYEIEAAMCANRLSYSKQKPGTYLRQTALVSKDHHLGTLAHMRAAHLAAIAALQEQANEDAAMLDWLEQQNDRFANIDRITSCFGKFNGFDNLRAAIRYEMDAAVEARKNP